MRLGTLVCFILVLNAVSTIPGINPWSSANFNLYRIIFSINVNVKVQLMLKLIAPAMKIFVQQVGGPKFELQEVNFFATGHEIKEMIHKIKPNTQVDDMRLVFNGKQMNDGLPVAGYDVEDGETLTLVTRYG